MKITIDLDDSEGRRLTCWLERATTALERLEILRAQHHRAEGLPPPVARLIDRAVIDTLGDGWGESHQRLQQAILKAAQLAWDRLPVGGDIPSMVSRVVELFGVKPPPVDELAKILRELS